MIILKLNALSTLSAGSFVTLLSNGLGPDLGLAILSIFVC